MASTSITSTVNDPPRVFFVDRNTRDLEPSRRATEGDAIGWQVLRRCLGAVGAWHVNGPDSWVSASYVGNGLALTAQHTLGNRQRRCWQQVAWADGGRSKVTGLFAAGDAHDDWALLTLEQGGYLPTTQLLPTKWDERDVALMHFSGAIERNDQHHHGNGPLLQYSGVNPQRRSGSSHLRHRCDTAPGGSGCPVLTIVDGEPRLMAVHGSGTSASGEWNQAVLIQAIRLPNGQLLIE